MRFPPIEVVGEIPPISIDLTRRIRAAYWHSMMSFKDTGSELWKLIGERKHDVHRALADMLDEELAAFFSKPAENDLFSGMDPLCRTQTMPAEEELLTRGEWAGNALYRLAESIGVVCLRYPEAPKASPDPVFDTETLLDGISVVVGEIDFPNPFAGELGLASSRGLISWRACNAIYQAHLLKRLSGNSVLEIGAGLGRTAYYAHKFGLGPYSIVDIPMTNVAQGLFLGSTLPSVRLCGEPDFGQPVAIFDANGVMPAADIVFNADSLTELDRDTAERYVEHIRRTAKVFLSINHEFNPFRTCDVGELMKYRSSREPYWLRPGYVVELFHF